MNTPLLLNKAIVYELPHLSFKNLRSSKIFFIYNLNNKKPLILPFKLPQ